jgi:hypothetical protein
MKCKGTLHDNPKNRSARSVRDQKMAGQIGRGPGLRPPGGTWNKVEKVWELSFRAAQALGLEKRIVDEI